VQLKSGGLLVFFENGGFVGGEKGQNFVHKSVWFYDVRRKKISSILWIFI